MKLPYMRFELINFLYVCCKLSNPPHPPLGHTRYVVSL